MYIEKSFSLLRLTVHILIVWLCLPIYAQPVWNYQVDPSFSTENLFRNASESVIHILPLGDGRLVLSGTFEQSSPFTSPFRGIGRIMPDGSEDIWAGANVSSANHTHLMSDSTFLLVAGLSTAGKITFAGDYWSISNGSGWGDYFVPYWIDPPNPYNVGNVWSLFVEDDEKVIIGGAIASDTLQPNLYRILTRLHPDGAHDPSFPVVEAQPNNSQIYANRIHRDSQGRWYISGNFHGINNHPTYYIARLNPDFSVDESFTSPFIPTIGPLIQPKVVYIDEGDRVWISGSKMSMVTNPANYIQMLRLMPDGTVDESFISRKLKFQYSNLDEYFEYGPRGPLINGVHKLGETDLYIVHGQFSHYNDTTSSCIAVVNYSGTLQPGYFNETGAQGNISPSPFGPTFYFPTILALHETSDGDLVLGGSFGKFDDVEHYNVVKLKRSTVGTSDAAAQRDLLRLWPNPASNKVFLALPGHTLIRAILRDMQGREVLSVQLKGDRTEVDVSHLPKGMYLLRATETGGGVYVKKLVVQ